MCGIDCVDPTKLHKGRDERKAMCGVDSLPKEDPTKLPKAMYNPSKTGCKIVKDYVWGRLCRAHKIDMRFLSMIWNFIQYNILQSYNPSWHSIITTIQSL